MEPKSESETLKCQDNFIKALKEVADEIVSAGKNKIEGFVTFGDGVQEVDINFSIEVSNLRNTEGEKNIQALSQKEINEMNQKEYENPGSVDYDS